VKNHQRERPIVVVVKKRGGHAHHGGAWKVAFADFMTALMALFLVLWIVGQSSDVKSAIAGYFSDPLGRADEFGSSVLAGAGAARPLLNAPLSMEEVIDPHIDRMKRLARHIEDGLRELPEFESMRNHIEIELVDEGLRIELIENTRGMFFELGSAVPNEKARALLWQLGADMSILPNQIVIDGHTDARPYSGRSRYTNWELSADRANAARRLLVDGGLKPMQISEVRGLADRQLRVPDDPSSSANRRVTITMLTGVSLLEAVRDPRQGGVDTLAAPSTPPPVSEPAGQRP
jgi:chemotaxis protein MotB